LSGIGFFQGAQLTITLEPHALAVLLLAGLAFVSFSIGRIALETTSLLVLVALVLGFHLFPYEGEGVVLAPHEFFLGFGHEAVVTISALMIIGRTLALTGALEPAGRLLGQALAAHPRMAMLGVLVFCAAASGVLNDTPIVVIMMPVLVSAALRGGASSVKTLMPMNYAVLVGGMGTTIGTSTNLLVVSIAADLGVRRFDMFDFMPLTALAAIGAIAYLWLVLPRLLPERESPMANVKPQIYAAVLSLREDSNAIEKPLSETMKKGGKTLRAERIVRRDTELARLPTLLLAAGDRIHVRGAAKDLHEFAQQIGASMHNVGKPEEEIDEEHPLAQPDQRLAEVVVTERSSLDRTTVRNTRFADVHDVVVVGLHRAGAGAIARGEDIADVRLRAGDVVLVQGGEKQIAALRGDTGLLVLDTTLELPRTRKAPLAIAIALAVVIAAATKLLPIHAAALAGVGLVILTRCIDWDQAAGALSLKVVLLVVASLALGAALTRTGGTDAIASAFINVTSGMDSRWLAPLLMLLMAALTNFVSNNAAAAIGTPIAVSMSAQLGVAPEPLVLAVLFGANFCYLTPMAYQTNLLVMAAAGYRFSDFVIGGAPLLLIMLASYTFLLPRFFPL
jgi:di/tricarboxylate transporter